MAVSRAAIAPVGHGGSRDQMIARQTPIAVIFVHRNTVEGHVSLDRHGKVSAFGAVREVTA
jgi:hypothetical protein